MKRPFLSLPQSISRFILVIIAAWVLMIVMVLVWQIAQIRQNTLDNARIQARVAFDKDILYRQWASMHGGVYVPITNSTPPNPYLADVAERDITTPSGKRLTLMNPAYMTREVHEIEEQESGVRGHITSLKPIRPENAADDWETQALQSFGQGNPESTTLALMDGKEYFRFMRPLVTEESCLACHAVQGYRVGDIRGGLSISIPLVSLTQIENDQIRSITLALALIWTAGMIGIALGAQQIKSSEVHRRAAEELLLYQKNRDVLTGLFNRAFLEEEMHRLETESKFPISIIVADVDGLKHVNDTLGHAAGDELLRHTANIFKISFRSQDVIARWGGDEFVVLLPLTDSAHTEECMERTKQTLANYRIEHQLPLLDFSLGGATATQSDQILPEVFRLADERMYNEKRARKQSVPHSTAPASRA